MLPDEVPVQLDAYLVAVEFSSVVHIARARTARSEGTYSAVLNGRMARGAVHRLVQESASQTACLSTGHRTAHAWEHRKATRTLFAREKSTRIACTSS
eukprot:3932043-Rhodomonas_salina.2